MAVKARMGKREAELARDGWKKQTTYDEPRLGELKQFYEEMGFEVRLEEPEAEDLSECTACMDAAPGALKTIYTRVKKLP